MIMFCFLCTEMTDFFFYYIDEFVHWMEILCKLEIYKEIERDGKEKEKDR